MMCVMRFVLINRFLPSLLEMRISSTGHLVGESSDVSLSFCLLAGTNRMWFVGIRMRVSRLRWLRIPAAVHGVSSQTGSTKTTKNGVMVSSDEERTCITALRMSSGVVFRVGGARACQAVAEGVV